MEELIRELENSLSGVLEEQLSLAVQWARQQDQQVLALTRQLAEGVASPFQPDDLARYRDACRQHWQQLLRRQWLAGFRSALGLEAVFQPDQQPPAASCFFPSLSAQQAQTLRCRQQTEERLFQAQAPYIHLAGQQAGLLVAQLR